MARKLALGIGTALVAIAGIGLLVRRRTEPAPAPWLAPQGPATGMAGLPAPTRPSCLECVDKHLGAAWVLMAETRDGYDHRLRVIGHLHEAEDESQAFPLLHDAIRAARKDYQQNDVTPPFEVLEQLARRMRKA